MLLENLPFLSSHLLAYSVIKPHLRPEHWWAVMTSNLPIGNLVPPQSARIGICYYSRSIRSPRPSKPMHMAILTTICRLLHRWNSHHLWWDDFWVTVAFLADTTTFVLYLVGLRVDTTNISGARWAMVLGYASTLW